MRANTYLEPRDFLDEAIVKHRKDGGIVYSYFKLIKAYMKQGMSEEDAVGWVEYNTIRSLPYLPRPKPSIKYDYLHQAE